MYSPTCRPRRCLRRRDGPRRVVEMTKLVRCTECGGQVGWAAVACPHCAAEYPAGHLCRICWGGVRHAESFDVGKEKGLPIHWWLHISCLAAVDQELQSSQVVCPNCKAAVAGHLPGICPSCEQSLSGLYETCLVCGRLVVRSAAARRTYAKARAPVYAHQICLRNNEQWVRRWADSSFPGRFQEWVTQAIAKQLGSETL